MHKVIVMEEAICFFMLGVIYCYWIFQHLLIDNRLLNSGMNKINVPHIKIIQHNTHITFQTLKFIQIIMETFVHDIISVLSFKVV